MKLVPGKILNCETTKKFALLNNDGDELGYSQIRLIPGCSPDLPAECANHIYYEIYPQFRGQGLGTVLMGLVIDKARELGLHQIKISCDKSDRISKSIIEKFASYTGEYRDIHGDTVLMYSVD